MNLLQEEIEFSLNRRVDPVIRNLLQNPRWWWLVHPNSFTMLRIVGTPPLLWMYLNGYPQIVIATLFFVLAVSDLIDGWIARRYDLITTAGKTLDPLADKIVALSFLYVFWRNGTLYDWIFQILVARELIITLGRFWAWKKKEDVSAKRLGKIKGLFEYGGVWFFLCGMPEIGNSLLFIAVPFAIVSLVQYALSWDFVALPIIFGLATLLRWHRWIVHHPRYIFIACAIGATLWVIWSSG